MCLLFRQTAISVSQAPVRTRGHATTTSATTPAHVRAASLAGIVRLVSESPVASTRAKINSIFTLHDPNCSSLENMRSDQISVSNDKQPDAFFFSFLVL